jgi:hypothetical protein
MTMKLTTTGRNSKSVNAASVASMRRPDSILEPYLEELHAVLSARSPR